MIAKTLNVTNRVATISRRRPGCRRPRGGSCAPYASRIEKMPIQGAIPRYSRRCGASSPAVATALVGRLHAPAEQDHRHVAGRDGHQRRDVADVRDVGDRDDHHRAAERVLDPPERVHPAGQPGLVARAERPAGDEMGDRAHRQERGDEPGERHREELDLGLLDAGERAVLKVELDRGNVRSEGGGGARHGEHREELGAVKEGQDPVPASTSKRARSTGDGGRHGWRPGEGRFGADYLVPSMDHFGMS